MRCLENTAWGWRIGLVVLLGLDAVIANGSRAGQVASLNASASLSSSSTTPETCESKTINYITHTLPQQCLRTAWTSATPTDGPPADTASAESGSPASTVAVPEVTSSTQPQPSDDGEPPKNKSQEEVTETEDLSTTTFMSFEEWKEMMLRKSGDPANIKARKQHEQRESKGERDAAGIAHGDLDSLGDDTEISLDFDALSEKVSEITAPSSGDLAGQTTETKKEEQVLYDDGKTQYYRSKDAGKTCKERFSYSSFDAGATILRTNPGAKNPKAILVENKDSYMLLECRAKNKFVVVELSDDILVDTVVLANFEFFSSMIRTFRVSVSDRYPGKWLDLGTFEARNSRDIQPFLVEHPQIYTKYIRIEFLTHYGNEFYCPVSLLRVHGTRMLDTWKDPPDNGHDEEPEQIEASPQEAEQIETGHQDNTTGVKSEASEVQENNTETQVIPALDWSPWDPALYYNISLETCVLRSPTTGEPTPVSADANGDNSIPAGRSNGSIAAESSPTAVHETGQPVGPSSANSSHESYTVRTRPTDTSPQPNPPEPSPPQPGNNSANSSSQKVQTVRVETAETPSAKASRASNATPTPPRNKTTAASGAAASPTVQESFFKSVTKRLQVLESNTTLSLQYIEEQSRFLQEVLLTIEKKQINRVDSFLNTLNKTVLTELRNVRTQYDQIWQSTVIALETQREQSQREIVALSSRLNVLAEEVVFQKRMAIVQSVLLLSCLVLVIFSRGLAGPSLPATERYNPNLMSPPRRGWGGSASIHDFNNSPSPPPTTQRGNDSSGGSRYYYSDKALPLTPASPDYIVGDRTRGRDNEGLDVVITPASPEYVEHGDGRQQLLEGNVLMTPPSSRAISEEPLLVKIPTPIPEETGTPEPDQVKEEEDGIQGVDVNHASPPIPEASSSPPQQHDIEGPIEEGTNHSKNDEEEDKMREQGENYESEASSKPSTATKKQNPAKRRGGSKTEAGVRGKKALPALPEDEDPR